jgi:hypothetical protein
VCSFSGVASGRVVAVAAHSVTVALPKKGLPGRGATCGGAGGGGGGGGGGLWRVDKEEMAAGQWGKVRHALAQLFHAAGGERQARRRALLVELRAPEFAGGADAPLDAASDAEVRARPPAVGAVESASLKSQPRVGHTHTHSAEQSKNKRGGKRCPAVPLHSPLPLPRSSLPYPNSKSHKNSNTPKIAKYTRW